MAAIERNPSASQADPDVIDALKGIGVALLSDQLRRNRGTKGLAPYHRPAAMAGTAVTVRTRGGDNLAILRAYDFRSWRPRHSNEPILQLPGRRVLLLKDCPIQRSQMRPHQPRGQVLSTRDVGHQFHREENGAANSRRPNGTICSPS